MNYGALCARSRSIVDQLNLFRAQRHHRSIRDVLYNQMNNYFTAFTHNSVDFKLHAASDLLI